MATSRNQHEQATATATAERPTIEALRQGMLGTIYAQGDTGYDEARTHFNAMVDRKPKYIARCRGTADVVEALRFAQAHELPVAVRGGGHGIAGHALIDDGLVIDLSQMRSVRVDQVKKTARAEGGATLRDVDHETQAYGLAVPLGMISMTGIAGLTLGGGVGWLRRKYGLACDNLISADVVTADGKLITASATKNKDLFWALRGGGGNFGVVTSFEYRLHPVSMVHAGLILYPVERAGELLRLHRDIFAKASDEFVAIAAFLDAPPAPFIAEQWHGKPMVGIACLHLGNAKDTERDLRPFRDLGPAVDFVGHMPYGAWQMALDETAPLGIQNYWKSTNLRVYNDDVIALLIKHNAGRPSPLGSIQVLPMGGAVNRVPADATAFPHRDVQYLVHMIGEWTDPAENPRYIAWAREAYKALEPYSRGSAYLNFIAEDTQDEVRAGYGANYDRLAQVKAKYDPRNVFHANQNIQPKA